MKWLNDAALTNLLWTYSFVCAWNFYVLQISLNQKNNENNDESCLETLHIEY